MALAGHLASTWAFESQSDNSDPESGGVSWMLTGYETPIYLQSQSLGSNPTNTQHLDAIYFTFISYKGLSGNFFSPKMKPVPKAS